MARSAPYQPLLLRILHCASGILAIANIPQKLRIRNNSWLTNYVIYVAIS